MKMILVQSSMLNAVGWEDGTLTVRFANGKEYTYDGVPEEVYKEMLESASVGRYYLQNIKGQY